MDKYVKYLQKEIIDDFNKGERSQVDGCVVMALTHLLGPIQATRAIRYAATKAFVCSRVADFQATRK